MTDVLVSYRQRDSGGWAGRIYERLVTRLGRESVHYALGDTSSDVAAAVAVIGPDWMTARHPETDTLITDPGDEVAGELAIILGMGRPVLPVLVDGASLPPAEALPPALRPLAEATPLVVRSLQFEADVIRLIAEVEAAGAAIPVPAAVPPAAARRGVIAIAILIALLGLGLAMALAVLSGAETGSAPVEYLLHA